MAETSFPRPYGEPELITSTYTYSYSDRTHKTTNTFPNSVTWTTSYPDPTGYGYIRVNGSGIKSDVSKSGYSIAGVSLAYGFTADTLSHQTIFQDVVYVTIADNILYMMTDGASQYGNSAYEFMVRVVYVKN